MKHVDNTIKRETLYIGSAVSALSILLQLTFAVNGKWNYTVLLGTLLGGFFAVLNFFLMGLSVQKALKNGEENIKSAIRASQSLRFTMLFIVAVIGAALPCFHTVSVLLPLLFPRLTIAIRPFLYSKTNKKDTA